MNSEQSAPVGVTADARRTGSFENRFQDRVRSARADSANTHRFGDHGSRSSVPVAGAAGDIQGTRPRVTERQRFVLAQIHATVRAMGVPPTVRELAAALDITSTNAVVDFIDALARKGMLERGARDRARSLRLTPLGVIYATGSDLVGDHQITRSEFVARELDAAQRELAARHDMLVATAVANGIDVPAHVLAEYEGGAR